MRLAPGLVTPGGAIPWSSGSGAKTYADFVTYITAQAAGGAKTWGVGGPIAAAGSYRTTAAAAAGDIYGSSWLSYMLDDIAPCRLVQHGLPSQAAFNAQVAGGFQVLFRITVPGNQINFPALNRNGYLSQAFNDGSPYPSRACDLLLYWDGTQAQQMNPSTGTGPTPFVIP